MSMMRSPFYFLALLFVLQLAGCGSTSQSLQMGVAPAVVGVGLQTNGVAPNRAIDVQFSTGMDPATINSGTFLLRQDSGGASVSGTVTYDAANAVGMFKPASALSANTTYDATITTGAADMAGDHLAANYVFSFVTRDSSDASDITVFKTIPASGQTGVAVTSNVQVVFSEGAAPNTVNAATLVVKDGHGAAVSGTVHYDIVTNNAVFTPAAPLMAGMTYAVTISGVTDLAGEAMAAPYTFSFTTAGGVATTEDFMYVTDDYAGNIRGSVFDSVAGTLVAMPGQPYPSGAQPYQMLASPHRDFLYVLMGEQPPSFHGTNCLNFNTQVFSYAIDPVSGALTQVQQVTLNGFCSTTGLAMDPAGQFLYVGETNSVDVGGMVDVLSLDTMGKMTLVAGSPFLSPETPTSLVVDGSYLFAGNQNESETHGLLTFARNPTTGTVQYMSGTTIDPQQSVAVSASTGTLYAEGNGTLSDGFKATISEFHVDSTTGALTLQGTITPASGGNQIMTDPTEHYLLQPATGEVDLYVIGPAGDLTQAPGSPVNVAGPGKNGGAAWASFDSTGAYFATLAAPSQIYSVNGGRPTLVLNFDVGTYGAATVLMVTK